MSLLFSEFNPIFLRKRSTAQQHPLCDMSSISFDPILFIPSDFQGHAWKSSGLLRGLTGLDLNPGYTLTQCHFPLISFNKQLESRFSSSQNGTQTALDKVSAI